MNQTISFEEDKVTHEPTAVLEGRFTIGDLMKVIHELGQRTGKMPAAVTTGNIEVMSIVSGETGLPMVELQSAAFDKPLQMDVAQAFEFGHVIIDAACTAISDATLAGFVHQELGVSREQAASLLFMFRGYRDRFLSGGSQEAP